MGISIFEHPELFDENGVRKSTPSNTPGMGNPKMPGGLKYDKKTGKGIGNTGSDFHNPSYQVGSGDSLR